MGIERPFRGPSWEDAEEQSKHADQALYFGKAHGRDKIVKYEAGMSKEGVS